MTMWRYIAVPSIDGRRLHGEIASSNSAEARATLRKAGLKIIDLKPLKLQGRFKACGALSQTINAHMRRRRQLLRGELFDSLATLLQSGLPIVEAIDSLVQSAHSRRSRSVRRMLGRLHEQLRDGESFAGALAEHESWFDQVELAMLSAAQHGGNLPLVLARLAQRHERAAVVAGKLASVLLYPAIVLLVGMGVTAFLSVQTLPQLSGILVNAGIEPPALTTAIMQIGSFTARNWMMMGASLFAMIAMIMVARGLIATRESGFMLRAASWRPMVLRQAAVSRLSIQLAELLRCGIPMVDALRLLAPTFGAAELRPVLKSAADRIERGEDIAAAMDDPAWFDSEFRQLVQVGQTAGELEELLERIGDRYRRSASRFIDRMTALIEPAVILLLASLVGTVVLAAVLPLIRLQELLR